MGNYKFRLSDMMPNAWFYRLRDMSKARNQKTNNPIKKKLSSPPQMPRKSFHYTPESIRVDNLYNPRKNCEESRDLYNISPRKSSKKKSKRSKIMCKPSPTQITPSVSDDFGYLGCGNSAFIKAETAQIRAPENIPTSPEHDFLEESIDHSYGSLDEDVYSGTSSIRRKLNSSSHDIIIDKNEMPSKAQNITKFNLVLEPELPPILTKPTSLGDFNNISSVEIPKENIIQPKKSTIIATKSTSRKSISRSKGVKIRADKPRVKSKKIETCGKKSAKDENKLRFYSESFAMVKSSIDPEKDFKDSMMEMIEENNIRASKELEELLVCYLSLNSSQYHDIIIKAFEQIWFTTTKSHV